MSQWKFLCSTACVALISGAPALADVTPEQVWENWKALSAAQGQTIAAASEAREGDALVVKGITMTTAQTGASGTLALDQATFTDAGDGSVVLTTSDVMTMAIKSAAIADTPETTTRVSFTLPGFTTKVSGSPEEMRYEMAGPSITVKLDGIDGDKDIPTDLKVEATMTGLAGDYMVSGSTEKTIASTFSAEGLAAIIAGSNPADASKVNVTLNVAGLSGQSNSKIIGDMADVAAALKAGTTMTGGFAYQSASFDMAVTDANGDMKMQGTNAGGDATFALDGSKLAYGGTVKDANITVSGAQIPFPQVNLAYKEGAFNLAMPVAKSDSPSDFAFLMKLADLTISDEIWNMFDPGQQLPRDPMTVHLDTTGKVKLAVDLMDETAMMGLQGAPGELHALDIKALQIKLAGADVTGTGALTFDNTDMTTFAGVPAPTGSVDLKAVGVNGLLDKLMAMGLVPEDQMMGARMMLGMFAKVVEGETDTMTSSIKFEDKHLFVNGMQLQ